VKGPGRAKGDRWGAPNYVQFSSDSLVTKLRRDVETALREGRLTYEESGALLHFYEEGLHGYTYLEDPHEL